jgi:threonyl-tRNA synthetase
VSYGQIYNTYDDVVNKLHEYNTLDNSVTQVSTYGQTRNLTPLYCILLTDKNIKAAEKLFEEFKEAGIRAEIDINSAPVQGKVRDAEMQKIPVIIMIGDKEEQAKTLAVRKDGKVKFGVKKEDFLKELLKEIKERK